MNYSAVNRLKDYQRITGATKTQIAKQSGLSRITIVKLLSETSKTTPEPETLGRVNLFINKKIKELEELK